MFYRLVFEVSGFAPYERVFETISHQPSVRRNGIDVSTALPQTIVADYVTLNVRMNEVS